MDQVSGTLDRPFVHLHCHSHYSLLDGAGTIDRLVERAKNLGMNSLALTDHGNLHGALEFYKKAKASGINPIIGYEAYVAPGSRYTRDADSAKEASYHLTLLAQNKTGFRNLIRLASRAHLEGFYYKPPKVHPGRRRQEPTTLPEASLWSPRGAPVQGSDEPIDGESYSSERWFPGQKSFSRRFSEKRGIRVR